MKEFNAQKMLEILREKGSPDADVLEGILARASEEEPVLDESDFTIYEHSKILGIKRTEGKNLERITIGDWCDITKTAHGEWLLTIGQYKIGVNLHEDERIVLAPRRTKHASD